VKADRKALVTLRFTGDELDLRESRRCYRSHRPGLIRRARGFFAGPNAGKLRGRTGMWFLATDKLSTATISPTICIS
jgi:hypothetical protein